MAEIVTYTETLYIQTATTLKEKLAKIESIIDALYTQMAENTANEMFEEYRIDDGQVKIETIYRSFSDVMAAINIFEKWAARIRNQLNGNVYVIRSAQGMR